MDCFYYTGEGLQSTGAGVAGAAIGCHRRVSGLLPEEEESLLQMGASSL